jgi:hypothetical protein
MCDDQLPYHSLHVMKATGVLRAESFIVELLVHVFCRQKF